MYKTLITEDRLRAIVQVAGKVPAGHFAELGVYKGGSLKYVAEKFPGRQFVGFDTFTGLPKGHWQESEVHQAGEFGDTSLEEVKQHIGLDNVTLVKGFFPRSAKAYENEQFALVHCDLDFEKGIQACLDFFWPRLVSGGAVVVDDYGWGNCPGVKKVLDAFGQPIVQLADYQAVIYKS